MSYIEKEKLIKADIASIENRVRHAFNQGYDLGFKDGKEKAKPQEQEPRKDEVILTNKEYRELISNEYENGYCKGYTVALEEQEPILDRVRAEIEQRPYGIANDNVIQGMKYERADILKILDKYKAESEE